MTNLMVKLSRRLADAVSTQFGNESASLERLVSSYGARLSRPVDKTGELARYFQISDVPNDTGEQLRRDLEQLEGVEAAYFKPADQLP